MMRKVIAQYTRYKFFLVMNIRLIIPSDFTYCVYEYELPANHVSRKRFNATLKDLRLNCSSLFFHKLFVKQKTRL